MIYYQYFDPYLGYEKYGLCLYFASEVTDQQLH